MCANDEPIRNVERMLAVATPLIAMDSHDHPHTQLRLIKMLDRKERPIILWNCVEGLTAGNEQGKQALTKIEPAKLKAAQAGLHIALVVAGDLPPGSVLIVDNLHWSWSSPAVMQAMLNLRESFKASKRAVIGLTLGSKMPADLVQNLSFVDDPLPSEEVLTETVQGIYRAVKEGQALDADEAKQIACELRGNAPFQAEQLTAQSVNRDGIDRTRVRANATKQINDTPGLSVEKAIVTFADIGGLDAILAYLRSYAKGPRSPNLYVRLEELEKQFSGVETESSGTSGDMLGVLLTCMEDNRWNGLFADGVSGCGKSLVAKAVANEFGVRALRLDMNACKDKHVGQSEQQFRQTMDMLYAIGGERVFFIASMNKGGKLPPELRRRFSAGTWYFDIPSDEARPKIWQIESKHFGVAWDGYDAACLTGADIRDIVQRSYELGCTTTEAARYHVPLCQAAPDAISESRNNATGRYLDANNGGPYRDPTKIQTRYERSFETI